MKTAEATKEEPRKCQECGSTEFPIFLYQGGTYLCDDCATRYLPDSKGEGMELWKS